MSHDEPRARIRRLQRWVWALTLVVLAGAITAPVVGSSIVDRQTAETQLVVTCTSARATVASLEAQRAFARELGVPWRYPIPEVPPECDGT